MRNGVSGRELRTRRVAAPLRPTTQQTPSILQEAPRITVAFLEISANDQVVPPLRVTITTGVPVAEVPTAVQTRVETHSMVTGEARSVGGLPRELHGPRVDRTVSRPPADVRARPRQVEVPAQPTATSVPADGWAVDVQVRLGEEVEIDSSRGRASMMPTATQRVAAQAVLVMVAPAPELLRAGDHLAPLVWEYARIGVAAPPSNGAPPAAQRLPEPHEIVERLAERNGLG